MWLPGSRNARPSDFFCLFSGVQDESEEGVEGICIVNLICRAACCGDDDFLLPPMKASITPSAIMFAKCKHVEVVQNASHLSKTLPNSYQLNMQYCL